MNEKDIAKSVIDIALGNEDSSNTLLLNPGTLDPQTVRMGCMYIAKWWCVQAIPYKLKPVKLNMNSILDKSCELLVNKSLPLQQFLEIHDHTLSFHKSYSIDKALEIIILGRDTYIGDLDTKL